MYRFIEFYDTFSKVKSAHSNNSFLILAPKIMSCCSDGKENLDNDQLLFLVNDILDYLSSSDYSSENIFNHFYHKKTLLYNNECKHFEAAQSRAETETLIFINSLLTSQTKRDLLQIIEDQMTFLPSEIIAKNFLV